MRIIYKTPENTVAVMTPSSSWPETRDAMEELAQRDVPTGCKYKIVADSDIPTDRTFRDAWEIDDSELTDGVGA